jgi:hypothetical protein
MSSDACGTRHHLCGHIAVVAAFVLLCHAAAQARPFVQLHQQSRLGRRKHALRQALHLSFSLVSEVLQFLAPPEMTLLSIAAASLLALAEHDCAQLTCGGRA